jgi:hypothetical protein
MKECSIPLTINKILVKTPLKFYFTSVRMGILNRKQPTTDAGEDVGQREPSYTVDGNVT